MKTLKQIINHWLQVNQDLHTAHKDYFQKRHDLLLLKTEYRLEMCNVKESGMCNDDKDIIYEFYDRHINRINNEVYWLDIFLEFNIDVK